MTAAVVPATEVRVDRLVELTHGMRKALERRGEYLPPDWVEESAADLRAGRLRGWAIAAEPGGLAVLSLNGPRAVGHVHLEDGGAEPDRGIALCRAVRTAVPPATPRTDLGTSGLSEAAEGTIAAALGADPGFSILRRFRLTRSTSDSLAEEGSPFPRGVRRIPVRDLPVEQLAQLDWAGFQGTPDEAFVAEDPAADERLLRGILEGRLGRFLDEASAVLVNDQDQLVGALLTGEDSPRTAVFLDLIVHPAFRRHGVARSLLRWGSRAGAALGYSTVSLWVTETNLPARRLYEAVGFRREQQTAIYRWVAGDAPGPQPQTAA